MKFSIEMGEAYDLISEEDSNDSVYDDVRGLCGVTGPWDNYYKETRIFSHGEIPSPENCRVIPYGVRE